MRASESTLHDTRSEPGEPPAGPPREPRPHWASTPRVLEAGIDFESANAARMYDYYLGGAHNFAVDREQADRVIAALPETVTVARANRAFLGRVVRWCLAHGIDQFLDLGSGVPTVGNVHEIAHQVDPTARVAYVDFEPVAVAHTEEIINKQGTTATVSITRADARDPDSVLAAPGVAGLLDFDRPIALLAITVLHFVAGDIATLLARYRAALAPGSVVAISHTSEDIADQAVADRLRAVREAYADSATPAYYRNRPELLAALEGLTLVEPGLVDIAEWPDNTEGREKGWVYGAVGTAPDTRAPQRRSGI